MLKLASLPLAALLIAISSPTLAVPSKDDPTPPVAQCVSPTRFGDKVTRIEGDALVKFRETATDLADDVDLVILLRSAPLAIAFAHGCAVSFGTVEAVKDDGSI